MLKNIFLSGAAVNFYAIIAGGTVGLLLKKGIPERVREILMSAVSLSVLYIGFSGLFEKEISALVVVLSLAIGAVIGELLNLDKGLTVFADNLQKKFSNGRKESTFSEGFITASLVFCIGAMAIVGSIDSGIRGDNATLYSKSLIDGITAAVFASTLGVGVLFSAAPVLAIEGILTLLATVVQPVLTGRIIAHMGVVGSILIIVIALNMLKLTKIKLMNLIPAVFLPILLCLVL